MRIACAFHDPFPGNWLWPAFHDPFPGNCFIQEISWLATDNINDIDSNISNRQMTWTLNNTKQQFGCWHLKWLPQFYESLAHLHILHHIFPCQSMKCFSNIGKILNNFSVITCSPRNYCVSLFVVGEGQKDTFQFNWLGAIPFCDTTWPRLCASDYKNEHLQVLTFAPDSRIRSNTEWRSRRCCSNILPWIMMLSKYTRQYEHSKTTSIRR